MGTIFQKFSDISGSIGKHGEFWRPVTSLFLHASFNHYFYNMLVLLIYACLLHRVTDSGFFRMMLFYLLTGVSGNVFSELSLAQNVGGIGASTSVYGIFGCLVGMMILNWKLFNQSQYSRHKAIIQMCFLLFLVFGSSSGKADKSINHSAHTGGLIAGVFIGMCLAQFKETSGGSFERKVKIAGFVGYTLMFVCSFLINFLR